MAAVNHVRDSSVNTFVIHDCDYLACMNTLADRLAAARKKAGLTQTQLANKAGVSQGTIGNAESGTRHMPRDLLKIAKALNVSPDWLATGDPGEAVAEPATRYDLGDEHVSVGGPIDPNEMVFVAAVRGASLSAGTGEVIYDVDEQKNAVAFRLDWMQGKGLRPERCKVWKVRGDSMEPRYSAGDALLIDMSDREPRHGKNFVLVGDEGMRVKQLLRGSEGWIMHSFNPDKARYPDEPIFDQNYAVIGRVRARSGDED